MASKFELLAPRVVGVVSREDLRRAGFPPWMLSELVRKRGWRRVLPGVFAPPGELDWKQRAKAAVLWAGAGAAISHLAAARLHGLDGFRTHEDGRDAAEPALHVTVDTGGPRHTTVTVHRRYEGFDVESVQGIPATSVVDTLFDVAAEAGEEQLELAVDHAWRTDRHLLSKLELKLMQSGKGSASATPLRRAIRECRRRGRPMDSALEVRAWRFLREYRLPLPMAGMQFIDDHGEMRPDFFYPRRGLSMECDGREAHDNSKAFQGDRDRTRRLAALGVVEIRLTNENLKPRRRASLAREIRDALRALPLRRARPVVRDAEPVPRSVLRIARPAWARALKPATGSAA